MRPKTVSTWAVTSYSEYVRAFADLVETGSSLPLPGPESLCPRSSSPKDSPTALIFSPHPDDEVIIGGLALRLLRQAGWRVINVAVTQGSNRARQAQRWEELTACCSRIGFELVATAENGLENINPAAAGANGPGWQQAVARIRDILEEHQPRLLFFPHKDDWNVTHIGVHLLVCQALAQASLNSAPWTCETEFWGQMSDPNLLVESSPEELADLVNALSCHVGEVRRNPYHLSLPAWMMENVRRAELVVGQGGASPPMRFGTMYRHGRWQAGEIQPIALGRPLIHAEDPAALFPA
jgi:LmbE family N-acetylglucosaminyl deacetylase